MQRRDQPELSRDGNIYDQLFPRSAYGLHMLDINSDLLIRMFTFNTDPITKLKASTL